MNTILGFIVRWANLLVIVSLAANYSQIKRGDDFVVCTIAIVCLTLSYTYWTIGVYNEPDE